MKYFLGVLLFVLASSGCAQEVKQLKIDGIIGLTVLDDVRKVVQDIQTNKIKKLDVQIISPGGDAIIGFTVSHMLRNLSNTGVIVEVHAYGMCASACTWILASGTPGHRFIDKYTFVLVHPVQSYKNGEVRCVAFIRDPKNVDDRIDNLYLTIARDLYMEFTGHSKETVEAWLTCGREQVGEGQLAVTLGMADKVE